jgi:hypothetical protein
MDQQQQHQQHQQAMNMMNTQPPQMQYAQSAQQYHHHHQQQQQQQPQSSMTAVVAAEGSAAAHQTAAAAGGAGQASGGASSYVPGTSALAQQQQQLNYQHLQQHHQQQLQMFWQGQMSEIEQVDLSVCLSVSSQTKIFFQLHPLASSSLLQKLKVYPSRRRRRCSRSKCSLASAIPHESVFGSNLLLIHLGFLTTSGNVWHLAPLKHLFVFLSFFRPVV